MFLASFPMVGRHGSSTSATIEFVRRRCIDLSLKSTVRGVTFPSRRGDKLCKCLWYWTRYGFARQRTQPFDVALLPEESLESTNLANRPPGHCQGVPCQPLERLSGMQQQARSRRFAGSARHCSGHGDAGGG